MCYLSTFLTYCNDFSITIINKGNLKTVMTKKLIYFFKLIVFDGKPVFYIKNVGSSVIHFARKMVDGLLACATSKCTKRTYLPYIFATQACTYG